MKAFRGTAVLSAFVVLLVAYTAWEYKKAGPDTASAGIEKKLFEFTPDQVSQVKLVRGKETVLIVREGPTEWKMKQPVEDDTETSAVEAFLYSLMIQKGKIFRGEDDAKGIDWAKFGLEPAGSVLELTVNKKIQSLQVSSKNAFDGSYYVRQGDDLMLGDHGLAQIVGRDSSTLRSRHLWREHGVKVETIGVALDIDGSKEKYAIKKDGEKLVLDPKPAFPVSSEKLDQWLSAIYNLVPGEIVGDTLTEEQKRADLLLKPSMEMKVAYKKSDGKPATWTLTVGQDRSDDVFLYTDQRPTIYRMPPSGLRSLRVGRDYFRDGKRPFTFAVEQAHEIQVDGHTLTKDGSNWKLTGAAPNLELNTEKLATLLQNITSLEAQEYVNANQGKGFKPGQAIVIRDSKGQILLNLTWGDEFKARQSWNKGMTFRFVKSNLEKDVLGVNAGKIASLIDPALVAAKAESKKTEK